MSEAPERIKIESECGHANTYNSEDRRTWLHFPDNAPDYFYAEYVRADRIEELEAELHLMKTAGICEVAARNPSVADYVKHWEGRAEEAEDKLAKAVEALEVLSNYENLSRSGGYYDGECVIFSYLARQRYGDFDDVARTTLAELTGGKDE